MLRYSYKRIGKIGRQEDVDFLLADGVADGSADTSSFIRPYGVGPYQEVDVSSFLCVIDARTEKEHLGLRIVGMDGAHNGIALPVRQPHEMNRRIAAAQSQASVSWDRRSPR